MPKFHMIIARQIFSRIWKDVPPGPLPVFYPYEQVNVFVTAREQRSSKNASRHKKFIRPFFAAVFYNELWKYITSLDNIQI